VGQDENRRNARRLMDEDSDALIGKAKEVCASKAKRGIHSLLPFDRCAAPSWKAGPQQL